MNRFTWEPGNIAIQDEDGFVSVPTMQKFNEHHAPAGDEHGGEFTSGSGAVITGPSGDKLFKNKEVATTAFKQLLGEAAVVNIQGGHNSMRLAHIAHDVLTEMKAKGYQLPQDLTIRSASARDSHAMSGLVMWQTDPYPVGHPELGYTHTPIMKLSVPSNIPRSANLDSAALAAFDGSTNGVRSYVGRTIRDTVIHEMGHIQVGHHKLDIDGLTAADRVWKDIPEAERFRVTDTISHYARQNADEFMAEAFSITYSGGKLSAPAAKLYAKLKGPKIR